MTATTEDPRQRLILALDVDDRTQARDMVRRTVASVGIYKVGLQLFVAEGPDLVRELVAEGARVFLDLKLHDIPNTVLGAA
ncbi:MAG TPA: orotidine 5'-phosphate decarboxylase, partial [Acidobacteriota bacterium]|nr:orotidine 5'-phosphate decarboxylase [Acidobacteriota bacterium]